MDNSFSWSVFGWRFAGVFGFLLAYAICVFIYRIYFHPLARFPGPKIAAVSHIWHTGHSLSGRWPFVINEAHKRYGNIVRISPTELSFASATAHYDIYGHGARSKGVFVKSEFYGTTDRMSGLLTLRDPKLHAARRKNLAPGFSARALREQTEMVMEYVDLFVKRLDEHSKSGPVEIGRWLNWLTFDIIGTLVFSEPFGAVDQAKDNVGITVLIDSFFARTRINLVRQLPFSKFLLPFFVTKNVIEAHKKNLSITHAKLGRRLQPNASDDSVKFVLSSKNLNLSPEQLLLEANTLMIAGSETTAASLTATIHLLLQHPLYLTLLQTEVRKTFISAADITSESLSRLPYLNAIIEESLRIFPPAPANFPRISPGAIVDSYFIPSGTIVGISTYALHHNSKHWREPEKFVPERWVEGSEYGKQDDRDAFRPFSAGTRACIGTNLAYLEMRIVLARLVWEFDWEGDGGGNDWLDKCRAIALWKRPSVMVGFKKRNT